MRRIHSSWTHWRLKREARQRQAIRERLDRRQEKRRAKLLRRLVDLDQMLRETVEELDQMPPQLTEQAPIPIPMAVVPPRQPQPTRLTPGSPKDPIPEPAPPSALEEIALRAGVQLPSP